MLEPAVDKQKNYAAPDHHRSDEAIAENLKAWIDMGATHIECRTRSAGLATMDDQIREITRWKMIADSVLS